MYVGGIAYIDLPARADIHAKFKIQLLSTYSASSSSAEMSLLGRQDTLYCRKPQVNFLPKWVSMFRLSYCMLNMTLGKLLFTLLSIFFLTFHLFTC